MAPSPTTPPLPRAIPGELLDSRVALFRPAAKPVHSESSFRQVFDERRTLLVFLRHQG